MMPRPANLVRFAALALAVALPAAAGQAADLKVLTVGRPYEFTTMDPPRQFDVESDRVVQLLYSTLLSYSYLERPYKLVPNLLARMPEAGADKVTYTFTLRQGVTFHDDPCFPGGKGRELTSDDVLYTLKRFADSNVNNITWSTMQGAVVGLDAFRESTKKPGASIDYTKREVEGLKKLDRYRFTIKLTRENPLFMFVLAMSTTSIVPMEAVQFYKDQFGVHPVGTGPFTIKQVDRKRVMRFTRYERYHDTYPTVGEPGDEQKGLLKAAGRKLPLVDVVEMPLIEEAQPEALKFLRGEIDWRAMDRANFIKMIRRNPDGTFKLTDEFASKFTIYWAQGLDTFYIFINMKDPVLGQNKALRQALAHLLDTNGRIDVLLNGRGRRVNSMVPLDIPGSEHDTGAKAREFNVAEAKRLLAEAGYPGGKGLPPLTISLITGTTDIRNAFDYMKAKFALAGVQVKPLYLDGPTFSKNVEGSNFQLAEWGWVADYPDAEDFYQLLYSKNVAPGPNYGSFVNAAYDRAFEASRFMANGPARYQYFKEMNEIINEEVPVIIQFDSLRFGILQNWVGNFKRNLLRFEVPFLDVDMDRKRKGL